MSWMFGESFFAVSTIMPVYLSFFTNSPLLIGLIPAIRDAGWFLPQLFLAPHVEKLDRKLPTVAKLGLLERLPFLVFAIATLWLPTLDSNLSVYIILLLWLWYAMASGLVALPWQELIAKVIPVSHRGRFFGISNLLGSLLAVIGAGIAGIVLANIEFPQNYSIIFLFGFIGVCISYIFLLLNDEPEIKVNQEKAADSLPFKARISQIFSQDKNFGRYILSRGCDYLGRMAMGFIAIYAIWKFDLSPTYSAIFAAIIAGSSMIGFPMWGAIGDRVGHKRVLMSSNLVWLTALTLLLLAPSVIYINLVFALLGFSQTGAFIGDMNIAMEFGREEDRPTYIGLARTITGPILLIAPIIGGVIVQWFGYPSLIGVSMAFSILGLLVLWRRVADPRPEQA